MATITVSGYVGTFEISTYGEKEHELLKFTLHEHHWYSPEKGTYIEKGKTVHYCNVWGEKIHQVKDLITTGASVLVLGEQTTNFSTDCDEDGKPKKQFTSINVKEMGFTPHRIQSISFREKNQSNKN